MQNNINYSNKFNNSYSPTKEKNMKENILTFKINEVIQPYSATKHNPTPFKTAHRQCKGCH